MLISIHLHCLFISIYFDTFEKYSLLSEVAHHRCSYKKVFQNMQQIYMRVPMPKCNFKATLLNRTWALVFSCKFAAYFRNTFLYKDLSTTGSALHSIIYYSFFLYLPFFFSTCFFCLLSMY